jgi:hypothetical protein
LRQVFVVLAGRIEKEETRVDGRALTSRRGGVVGRAVGRRILFEEESAVSDDLTGSSDIGKSIWDNKIRISILRNQYGRGGKDINFFFNNSFVPRERLSDVLLRDVGFLLQPKLIGVKGGIEVTSDKFVVGDFKDTADAALRRRWSSRIPAIMTCLEDRCHKRFGR